MNFQEGIVFAARIVTCNLAGTLEDVKKCRGDLGVNVGPTLWVQPIFVVPQVVVVQLAPVTMPVAPGGG